MGRVINISRYFLAAATLYFGLLGGLVWLLRVTAGGDLRRVEGGTALTLADRYAYNMRQKCVMEISCWQVNGLIFK